MLNEYDDMEEEIKNQNLYEFTEEFCPFIKQWHRIVWSVEKIQKVKIQKLERQRQKNNAFIKMWSLW